MFKISVSNTHFYTDSNNRAFSERGETAKPKDNFNFPNSFNVAEAQLKVFFAFNDNIRHQFFANFSYSPV